MSKKTTVIVFSGIILILLSFIGYGIYQYTHLSSELNKLKTTPGQSGELARSENEALVKRVGKMILLPKDEEPTIASVTDKEKLKGQQFFVNAEIGDKMILYLNNRKAILFRPSNGMIIEVSTVNVTDKEATSGPN
jgi:hypothetical protein